MIKWLINVFLTEFGWLVINETPMPMQLIE